MGDSDKGVAFLDDVRSRRAKENARAAAQDDLGLDKNGNGIAHSNVANVVRALSRHPKWKDAIWFDEFHGRVFTDQGGTEHEWSDADDVSATVWLQTEVGLHKVAVATVADAVGHVARLHVRNEPRDFLERLEWDRQERLPRLMSRGFGAEDSDYTRAVGQNFIIGMVARVLRPGCKVDTMPVLEGAQGIRKSSGLGILGGKWFAELHQDIANKDFYLALQGKMLLEFSEMHALNRSESERLKGVVSCQIDRYRAPFDRRAVDHPRRCVFAGTTNRDDWARDDTGARRFWPIECGRIDLDWLTVNRDQLLAEAVAKFNAGASWWDVPADDARREQDARRPEDPWQPTIAYWLIGRSEVTVTDILASCLRLDAARQDKSAQMRVAEILKHLGWKGVQKSDATRKRYWIRR